jgi:hypothetical protein
MAYFNQDHPLIKWQKKLDFSWLLRFFIGGLEKRLFPELITEYL